MQLAYIIIRCAYNIQARARRCIYTARVRLELGARVGGSERYRVCLSLFMCAHEMGWIRHRNNGIYNISPVTRAGRASLLCCFCRCHSRELRGALARSRAQLFSKVFIRARELIVGIHRAREAMACV